MLPIRNRKSGFDQALTALSEGEPGPVQFRCSVLHSGGWHQGRGGGWCFPCDLTLYVLGSQGLEVCD